MSQANLWAALQQSALVGADRLAVPAILTTPDVTTPATVQAVQIALQMALQQPAAPAAKVSTAAQVLRASAVASVLERAGWVPGSQVQLSVALTAPAQPVQELRVAPVDEQLTALVEAVVADGPQDLLALSFAELDKAGLRLPHGLLVAALNQGRQSTELREWLLPVLGERGRWLAAQNPQWAYATGVQETADPEQIWQEGSIAQRVSLLESERESDPAKARVRLEASLKELNAKERALMVQALDKGLSMDDEPLLEKLLADRSKEVRENAAQLLTRLPVSAHSQRMAAWLQAMLSCDDKGDWQIEPPTEGNKDWERDGVTLQLPAYVKGERSWWLQQLVALTPVEFWQQALDKSPEQLWEWSRRSDWKTALRQGWLRALDTQHDLRWLPLLQSMESDSRAQALLPPLLVQLSTEQREALWMERLQRKQGQSGLIDSINNIDDTMGPVALLSQGISQWIVDALYLATRGKQAQGNWHSWQADRAVLACAKRLDASVLSRFADLWRIPAPEDELPAANETEPKESVQGPNAEANAETIARLKAEQAARRARARLRPWDDERVLEQLNRTVDLRLALHAATLASPSY
ncbi:MAG: DUF5691 domain-containing protein [Comamonas sp.]|jgi:hypothetical protein|nr:DUF5691 domain-containing protein [Comamonas sp.]